MEIRIVGESASVVRYLAESSGFSTFAIVGEKEINSTLTLLSPEPIEEQPNIQKGTNVDSKLSPKTTAQRDLETNPNTTDTSLLVGILTVIIGVVIVSCHILTTRRNERRKFKEK